MSYSDSKSYDDTSSTAFRRLPTISTSLTPPPRSRSGSPVRSCIMSAIEKDLLGIGGEGALPINPIYRADVPTHLRTSLRPEADRDAIHPSQSSLPKRGAHITNDDQFAITQPRSAQQSIGTDRSTVYGYGGNPCSIDDLPVVYEGVSSSDDSEEEEEVDIALEKAADDLLSQWFGISLSRLARPIRVIYALEGVKEQCVSILQEEGQPIYDHQYDQPETRDGEEESYSPEGSLSRGDRPNGDESSLSGFRKRWNGENERGDGDGDRMEASAVSMTLAKSQGPKKKRRVHGELSCPYRKRNPLRFNVRDHNDCANKSYLDMTNLKKHLLARHLQRCHSCSRCLEKFETSADLLSHSQHCPHSPQPQVPVQLPDPEDGFGEVIENILRSRKNRDRIDDWETLYQVLFPTDKTVPTSDFEPVFEHHEVANEYNSRKPKLEENMRSLLIESLPDLAEGRVYLLARDVSKICQTIINSLLRDSKCAPQYEDGQTQQASLETRPPQLSHIASKGFNRHICGGNGGDVRREDTRSQEAQDVSEYSPLLSTNNTVEKHHCHSKSIIDSAPKFPTSAERVDDSEFASSFPELFPDMSSSFQSIDCLSASNVVPENAMSALITVEANQWCSQVSNSATQFSVESFPGHSLQWMGSDIGIYGLPHSEADGETMEGDVMGLTYN
ncbi:hypothetical protein OIDMADRAFT_181249 [Oidiodendron maius Zn]|uniref:C2H2-type domain-containing protein n=1 Tax=Oidiodendron maius (strain Zn) TaxID=913774 RepID=A0A0C3GV30_OIDMZ|nr:hypothetical protein OIDMADRAFT_181249 [Oidiodendron maius Zn]